MTSMNHFKITHQTARSVAKTTLFIKKVHRNLGIKAEKSLEMSVEEEKLQCTVLHRSRKILIFSNSILSYEFLSYETFDRNNHMSRNTFSRKFVKNLQKLDERKSYYLVGFMIKIDIFSPSKFLVEAAAE